MKRCGKSLFDDPYLKPYEGELRSRAARADEKERALTGGMPLAEWARAHEYYGLHRRRGGGWTFREWAPNATGIWLVGDFSGWKTEEAYRLRRIAGTGDWEARLPAGAMKDGDNYILEVEWEGGRGERLPAYATYVTQDPSTKLFSAKVRAGGGRARRRPAPPPPSGEAPVIYEAHVGMASEEGKVATYSEFRDHILPRIKKAGFNTVQLMAVMEHPYYGSFGYHVGSFFAASSRFGTPEDLKSLIDAAHRAGLRVVMDLVHSHAVRNERDGLGLFDGTQWQYFHDGARGRHSAWDSLLFDYSKPQVLRFLLSNCRFWLEEYGFDGFRFDGVTSMLFLDHGLGAAFTDYSMYFGPNVDLDAWTYLRLANKTIHQTRPDAITIAEDVSGMPGCAARLDDCGMGFDYRMAMGGPDFWFRLASKTRDEDWPMGGMFRELSGKRAEERTASYVECHDQALVGGKTFFFQLADAAVYDGMGTGQHSGAVDRAMALHKMARLATCALNGGAYLEFMGNEFGHPEWIDFPREGNGWDYSHARRQWSLRDDPALKFKALGDFGEAMLAALAPVLRKDAPPPVLLLADERRKLLAFMRGEMLFAFNFNPVESFEGCGITVPPATRWRHVLDTDEARFGGWGRIARGMEYETAPARTGAEIVERTLLYLPSRTAVALTSRPRPASRRPSP